MATRFCILLTITIVIAKALMAGPAITKPTRTGKTSFAIFVDSATYARTAKAVDAYRTSVEADGLPTYLIVDVWQTPDDVRRQILMLRHQRPPLEGMVFIGEVPIPMLRDAQHMTTAFKMDPERPWTESSVPSDRFYDDLDLKCTYLKRDSLKPLLHYYSLDPDSPQRVERELYSGRILPAGSAEVRNPLIEKYLFRVAAQKRSTDTLDHILTFTGHGYNSEALSAWEGMLLTLREQFPALYAPGGGMVKSLYHTMSPNMKSILLTELQQPELDMAVFHAHGADDTQYLLGNMPATTIDQHVEAIRQFLRSKLRTAQRRKQSVEEAKAYYTKAYGIPESWFAGTFADSLVAADSVEAERLDLYVKDINKIPTSPRFVMFDECFNGNFTASEYVAGAYVFGEGTTVAAVGNTVNILQDIWADEFLGLLGCGVRVGNWHRMRNSLESHIIGDPTFHFRNRVGFDVNAVITTQQREIKVIERLTTDRDPVLRTLGVEMLHAALGEKSLARLAQIYQHDPSFIVRIQAMKGLAESRGPVFEELLKIAVHDPSEYIRRLSVKWMGETGRLEYLTLLVQSAFTDQSERVSFNADGALETMGADSTLGALHRFVGTMPAAFDGKKQLEYVERGVRSKQEWLNNELLHYATSDTARLRKRLSSIRSFRNYNFKEAVPTLVEVAENEQQKPEVRTAILEALGWFTFAYNRDVILAACDSVARQTTVPLRVKQEALKTRNRLLTGANNPMSP